jgi:membrane protein YqaA with SNARE-associated domain
MLVNLTLVNPVWVYAWVFCLTIVSAIIPWVNAEVIVLSLPALAASRESLVGLVLVATLGQMTGKCAVYWAGRGSGRVLPPRVDRAVARWSNRLASRPSKAAALILVSSIVGLPPFYVMSLVAGALRMNFAVYIACGTVGRLIRFGSLLLIPHFALPWLRGG